VVDGAAEDSNSNPDPLHYANAFALPLSYCGALEAGILPRSHPTKGCRPACTFCAAFCCKAKITCSPSPSVVAPRAAPCLDCVMTPSPVISGADRRRSRRRSSRRRTLPYAKLGSIHHKTSGMPTCRPFRASRSNWNSIRPIHHQPARNALSGPYRVLRSGGVDDVLFQHRRP